MSRRDAYNGLRVGIDTSVAVLDTAEMVGVHPAHPPRQFRQRPPVSQPVATELLAEMSGHAAVTRASCAIRAVHTSNRATVRRELHRLAQINHTFRTKEAATEGTRIMTSGKDLAKPDDRNSWPGNAMPAGPPHRLWQLTSSELANWRKQLERAIEEADDDDPVQGEFREAVDDVKAEEESRAKIAEANGRS